MYARVTIVQVYAMDIHSFDWYRPSVAKKEKIDESTY